MYQRILVPLDGSKAGESALPYVEELVSKLSPEVKVEITLLQVVSSGTYYVADGEAFVPIPYTKKEMRRIKKKATDYLSRAGEGLRSRGAIVKTKVGIGRTAEEIVKAANEINADLIAMSRRGRSPIRRWTLSSVTNRVLRGEHKPVLLVRTAKEPDQT